MIKRGTKSANGQAFIITTLHALDTPTPSIILSGNQYIPQADALRNVAKLKLVSEYVLVRIYSFVIRFNRRLFFRRIVRKFDKIENRGFFQLFEHIQIDQPNA